MQGDLNCLIGVGGCFDLACYPDPQRDLKIRSPRTIWECFKDYIGVIMGLYRGSNF